MCDNKEKQLRVSFTGISGGGKSTLIPLTIHCLNSNHDNAFRVKQVTPLTTSRIAFVILLNPYVLVKSFLITRKMKPKYRSLFGYLRWIKRLTSEKFYNSTSCFYKNNILLTDEGIIHYLKESQSPLSYEFVSSLPMPDIVINIKTDPIQAAWRRVLRQTAVPNYKILKKKDRQLKANKLAKMFLKKQSPEDTYFFLKQWSDKFCKPRLPDQDIKNIIESSKPRRIKSPKAIKSAKKHWLQQLLQENGVLWIDVDTGNKNNPEQNARLIADMIYAHYKEKHLTTTQ